MTTASDSFKTFVVEQRFHEQLMYCKQCKNPSLFHSRKYGTTNSMICHRCKMVRISQATETVLKQQRQRRVPLATQQKQNDAEPAPQSEEQERDEESARDRHPD